MIFFYSFYHNFLETTDVLILLGSLSAGFERSWFSGIPNFNDSSIFFAVSFRFLLKLLVPSCFFGCSCLKALKWMIYWNLHHYFKLFLLIFNKNFKRFLSGSCSLTGEGARCRTAELNFRFFFTKPPSIRAISSKFLTLRANLNWINF